jgi:hypothetical protein
MLRVGVLWLVVVAPLAGCAQPPVLDDEPAWEPVVTPRLVTTYINDTMDASVVGRLAHYPVAVVDMVVLR